MECDDRKVVLGSSLAMRYVASPAHGALEVLGDLMSNMWPSDETVSTGVGQRVDIVRGRRVSRFLAVPPADCEPCGFTKPTSTLVCLAARSTPWPLISTKFTKAVS